MSFFSRHRGPDVNFKTKGWKPPKARKRKVTSAEVAEATKRFLEQGGRIRNENFWPPRILEVSETPCIPTPIVGNDAHNFLDEFDGN